MRILQTGHLFSLYRIRREGVSLRFNARAMRYWLTVLFIESFTVLATMEGRVVKVMDGDNRK